MLSKSAFPPRPQRSPKATARVLLEDDSTGTRYRESFDLAIGADGLRSGVRRLAFGPHQEFMTTWSAMICAFPLPVQAPSFAAQDGLISARAERAVWVFGLADRAPTALLTYCTKDIDAQFTGDRAERPRAVFDDMGHPAVRHALDALPATSDYPFDSVHQVTTKQWSTGRVLLTSIAAWCLNLFSGMGATAAVRGGSELARAPQAHPDGLAAALAAWEAGLRPFITTHQRMARLKHQWFVPTSRSLRGVRSRETGSGITGAGPHRRALLTEPLPIVGSVQVMVWGGPRNCSSTPRRTAGGLSSTEVRGLGRRDRENSCHGWSCCRR